MESRLLCSEAYQSWISQRSGSCLGAAHVVLMNMLLPFYWLRSSSLTPSTRKVPALPPQKQSRGVAGTALLLAPLRCLKKVLDQAFLKENMSYDTLRNKYNCAAADTLLSSPSTANFTDPAIDNIVNAGMWCVRCQHHPINLMFVNDAMSVCD
jgi:hypothetical protein